MEFIASRKGSKLVPRITDKGRVILLSPSESTRLSLIFSGSLLGDCAIAVRPQSSFQSIPSRGKFRKTSYTTYRILDAYQVPIEENIFPKIEPNESKVMAIEGRDVRRTMDLRMCESNASHRTTLTQFCFRSPAPTNIMIKDDQHTFFCFSLFVRNVPNWHEYEASARNTRNFSLN